MELFFFFNMEEILIGHWPSEGRLLPPRWPFGAISAPPPSFVSTRAPHPCRLRSPHLSRLRAPHPCQLRFLTWVDYGPPTWANYGLPTRADYGPAADTERCWSGDSHRARAVCKFDLRVWGCKIRIRIALRL